MYGLARCESAAADIVSVRTGKELVDACKPDVGGIRQEQRIRLECCGIDRPYP